MKITTLICAALTIMGVSWLLLAGAHRMQHSDSINNRIADIYISVTDDNNDPVSDYIVRIDGKILGKTNSNGMLAKTGLTIGNAPTITLSMRTMHAYEKSKETLLTLPEYRREERPAFTITSSLCFDFLSCDDDLHQIELGKKLANTRKSLSVGPQSSDFYDFRLVKSPDHDKKLSNVIRGLDKLLRQNPATTKGIAMDVTFTRVESKRSGSMIKVTGRHPQSASVKGEFSFLLPLKDDQSAMSNEIARFLSNSHPNKSKTGRMVKINFKEPLHDSYEVYAGGVAGNILSPLTWSLIVPESGRFFLTILQQGQVTVRKFFDVGASDLIEYEQK